MDSSTRLTYFDTRKLIIERKGDYDYGKETPTCNKEGACSKEAGY